MVGSAILAIEIVAAVIKARREQEIERHGQAPTIMERVRWLVEYPERRRKRREFAREFWRPATHEELAAIKLMSNEELEALSSIVRAGCRAVAMAARDEYERRDRADFKRLITEDSVNVDNYEAIENPNSEQVTEEIRRRAKLFAENE